MTNKDERLVATIEDRSGTHYIHLTDDYEFRATGPTIDDEDGGSTHSSLHQAKDAIKEAIALAAKAKVRDRTMKITVLDEVGEPANITGINRSSRQLTGLKKTRQHDVFPNVPWIAAALKALEELRAQTRSREDQLRPFEINAKRGYGHVDAHNYDGIVDAFELEVKQKTQKANQGEPPLKPIPRGRYLF